MPTVSLTWHTQHDDRVCPICKDIEGYTWVFIDKVPDSLVHPVHGEIWNVVTGSLAHEQPQFGKKSGLLSSCRCNLTSEIDLKDILAKVKTLVANINGESEIYDTQSGGKRTTSFEDLGIDPSKYGFE